MRWYLLPFLDFIMYSSVSSNSGTSSFCRVSCLCYWAGECCCQSHPAVPAAGTIDDDSADLEQVYWVSVSCHPSAAGMTCNLSFWFVDAWTVRGFWQRCSSVYVGGRFRVSCRHLEVMWGIESALRESFSVKLTVLLSRLSITKLYNDFYAYM